MVLATVVIVIYLKNYIHWYISKNDIQYSPENEIHIWLHSPQPICR